MNLNWSMIGVLLGALGTSVGIMRWWVRAIIREENELQIAKINGTYIRSYGASISGAEIVNRLDSLDKTLKELHGYTHDRIHELANSIQTLVSEEREERIHNNRREH